MYSLLVAGVIREKHTMDKDKVDFRSKIDLGKDKGQESIINEMNNQMITENQPDKLVKDHHSKVFSQDSLKLITIKMYNQIFKFHQL